MIRTHMGIVLSIVALVVVGCRDARAPSTPSTQPGVQQPSPNPTGVQPGIRTMAPRIGSTRGGAWSAITGTDFQAGATVKLGEVRVTTTVLDAETIADSDAGTSGGHRRRNRDQPWRPGRHIGRRLRLCATRDLRLQWRLGGPCRCGVRAGHALHDSEQRARKSALATSRRRWRSHLRRR